LKKLQRSMAGVEDKSRRTPINLDPYIMKFLMTITHPPELKHDASLADFIRNNVLEEIRRKIIHAEDKNSYGA